MGKMKELFMEQRAKENKNRHYPLTKEECYELKDCPICDGAGAFGESTCCGASIINGICDLCKEHTEPTPCDVCNGTGKVEKTEEDYEDEKENEIIANAEMMKDE